MGVKPTVFIKIGEIFTRVFADFVEKWLKLEKSPENGSFFYVAQKSKNLMNWSINITTGGLNNIQIGSG